MITAAEPGKKQWDRGLVFGALLLLFALAEYFSGRLGMPKAGQLKPIAQRKMMPALTTVDTHGNPWSIADHRGQVVLINYWATWCGPCQAETPGLVRLTQQEKSSGLAILAVSLDAGGATPANQQKVAAFATRYHVPYPIAFPPPGSQMEFGLDLIPTTVLVDRQGRIARLYEGAATEKVFASDIHQLQSEQ